jgi:hypothetical protein
VDQRRQQRISGSEETAEDQGTMTEERAATHAGVVVPQILWMPLYVPARTHSCLCWSVAMCCWSVGCGVGDP